MSERLRILSVSPFIPEPPTFGAQRRIQGLLASLGRRHDIDAIALATELDHRDAARQEMLRYCRRVELLAPRSRANWLKRIQQLRSLASPRSYEHASLRLFGLQDQIDELLSKNEYDIVMVELCFLASFDFRRASAGHPFPRLVVDEHNIEFDLTRQSTGLRLGLPRHVYNSVNWRKIRREEIAVWKKVDAAVFTSRPDDAKAKSIVPGLSTRVVPNGVDTEYFRTRSEDPTADDVTVLFFGTFNYFPNCDGMRYFLKDVWPLLTQQHSGARLKIIGADPPAELLAYRSDCVEFVGRVDDLRPHLAGSAVTIAPLLIGGGTRLKVVEAMAMSKAVVATSLGAEGIVARSGEELLLADSPEEFAAAVSGLLRDRDRRLRMGALARACVEQRYSWESAALELERFYREVLDH